MKTTGEIEEAMRSMGQRARRIATSRYALTREQLFKLQSTVRAESSTKAAARVTGKEHFGSKISEKAAGGPSVAPKKSDISPMSKELMDKVLREIHSGAPKPKNRQSQRFQISLKPKIDPAKTDKEANRYFALKEKLSREVGKGLLTSSQAENQLAKAREHLKSKLLASGAIKIAPS